MIKVKKVDVVKPPKIATLIGAHMAARPCPAGNNPGNITGNANGNTPKIVVIAVMMMGRIRSFPPWMIASFFGTPFFRSVRI